MRSGSLCDIEQLCLTEIEVQESVMWEEYDMELVNVGNERVCPLDADENDYVWWEE